MRKSIHRVLWQRSIYWIYESSTSNPSISSHRWSENDGSVSSNLPLFTAAAMTKGAEISYISTGLTISLEKPCWTEGLSVKKVIYPDLTWTSRKWYNRPQRQRTFRPWRPWWTWRQLETLWRRIRVDSEILLYSQFSFYYHSWKIFLWMSILVHIQTKLLQVFSFFEKQKTWIVAVNGEELLRYILFTQQAFLSSNPANYVLRSQSKWVVLIRKELDYE